ncbi:MAG TPA: HAD-IB family phosphatase [Terriglobales bacterium]|nr:HAD-IB family phosphatase [Terriglobales bacterium]
MQENRCLAARDFIASVLALNPANAAFDCDGTLWLGDAGADFFYWELDRGLLPPEVAARARKRYSIYEEGRVDEAVMCGEMVTLHRGLEERMVAQAAEEFFAEVVEPRIFSEMRELLAGLRDTGREVWAVSSTAEWVVRAGARRLGIAADRVLAASAVVENGRVTDRLIRVPTGAAKAQALREAGVTALDAAFGNTLHDLAMLEMARHAFAINPRPELEKVARERGWTIYRTH